MSQTNLPSDGERRSFYPEITAHTSGTLQVSPVHTLFYEEYGNPDGKPVVILHGGPGGGSNPTMARTHNPEAYRIILFDQRGSGRSTPHASLDQNTTWDLVDDIERLRTHLGIERWQVCGGSWGSCLGRDPSRPCDRADYAGYFHVTPAGTALVLSGGNRRALSRCLGKICGPHSRSRAR